MINSMARSLITAKKYYRNMLAGNAPYEIPGDFDLISTTILAADQGSIVLDVSGLSSTYKHLQIRFVARGFERLWMRLNDDTSYYNHMLWGNGSTYGAEGYSANAIRVHSDMNTTSPQFITGIVDLFDAFSTAKNKTAKVLSGRAEGVQMNSGLWASTSAITTISFAGGNTGYGGNIYTGTRISVYGIKG